MENVNIDLAALEAEISNLSPEEVQKQLLEVRTKQRVQQKKYSNSDAAKAYRKKRAEALKLIALKAKGLPASKPGFANMYEQILSDAKAKADEIVGTDEGEMADALAGDE